MNSTNPDFGSDAGRVVFVSFTGGLHGVRGRAGVGVNILCPYALTAMTAASAAPDLRLMAGAKSFPGGKAAFADFYPPRA